MEWSISEYTVIPKLYKVYITHPIFSSLNITTEPFINLSKLDNSKKAKECKQNGFKYLMAYNCHIKTCIGITRLFALKWSEGRLMTPFRYVSIEILRNADTLQRSHSYTFYC